MDQKVSQLLEDWHNILDSESTWGAPTSCYRYLMSIADRLLALSAIDPMERFEMMELASAAFSYYVEAKPEEWRVSSSNYAVFNEAGIRVGTLLGSRYVLHGPDVEPLHKGYLAILRDDNTLLTHTHHLYGRLEDRYIKTETGQKVVLVELNRQISGVIRTRIDDPDQYRAIVDAATLALEAGDFARYVHLWERENFSVFRQCSRCCDRFELRDDCTDCSGRGFVQNPHCPSKLPRNWGCQQKTTAP
ncbi:hypothetical protein [Pseudomonas viridiflava]|uniref:hypothetical protein n=1 Tax=Pseudomonas viridiflava TaxID=33069 RepID=UPI002B1E3AD8|nr:hypothetical protein [Pseudomonas viridiflava]